MSARAVEGANRLSKTLLSFLKKHPAIVAGGAGVGLGATELRTPAHHVENTIMREYLGAPGAKYSSCHIMEKFAERKMELAAKVSFEKIAGDPTFGGQFVEGAGKGMGGGVVSEGLGALRRLIGTAAQSISNRFVDEPKREKLVQQVLKHDPVISTAERESPGQALQAYQTMKQVAPALSTDPNVVQSYLRNAALSGGPIDFQTVRGLADAETSIQRARNEGAWLRGGF